MMNRLFLGLLLLITAIAGCHSDEVSIDLLYQTWQQTHAIRNDGKEIALSPHSSNILTFRKNGTILYGADGKYPICCNPIRFTRKGNTLDLIDVASIAIPSDVPIANCAAVDCIPPDSTWQIKVLTPTQLIIGKNYRGTAFYQPYP